MEKVFASVRSPLEISVAVARTSQSPFPLGDILKRMTMKTLKTIILLTLTLMLSSCGTSHNYTNKPFNKDFYKNQTIYLKLNPSSQDKIKFSGLVGTVLGGISQPDVKETFRTAIAEIADETKINVRFFDENLTESGEQNLVFDTTIKEINWHFGISVATLQTKLDYRNFEYPFLIITP